MPYAFTEQGAAMLSSVLRSRRAVAVNVEIMRAFVRLRAAVASVEELDRKLAALEQRYDAQFKVVFDAIRHLMRSPEPGRPQIGFRGTGEDQKTAPRSPPSPGRAGDRVNRIAEGDPSTGLDAPPVSLYVLGPHMHGTRACASAT